VFGMPRATSGNQDGREDGSMIPFFVWLLPLLCGICSYIHHSYPGDENGMWLLGSAPGLWIAPRVFLSGASKAAAAAGIAVALAVVMLAIGWTMDRFRVRKVLWAIVFAVCALGVLALSILGFPSIERALSKNGSWWAYILLSINVGVYLSVVVSAVLTFFTRRWQRRTEFSESAQEEPQSVM
jgi:MFS family permease